MLWDDFINSMWHDRRGSGRSEDRLEQEKWLTWFMRQDRVCAEAFPTEEERNEMRRLRHFLLDTVRHIVSGHEPDAGHIEQLNQWMNAGPVYRRLVMTEEHGPQLQEIPLNANWTQVMAEISASFASTLACGELSRIRICGNPDCLWVYYDDTRNRSKRYCDDKMCGNLMKVRRFRAKKKQEAASDGSETNPSS